MTNLLLVISSAIIGFMFHEGSLVPNLPFSVLLIVIGGYGVVFSRKHYERWSFHDRLCDKYRELLEEKYPNAVVERTPVEKELLKEFRLLHVLPLNSLWTILPLILMIIGIVLTTITLTSG